MLPIIPLSSIPCTSRGVRRTTSHFAPSFLSCTRSASHSDSLTLVFRENPLALVQWTVVDQQGKITTVSLYDAQFGVALDPGMFVLRARASNAAR